MIKFTSTLILLNILRAAIKYMYISYILLV